MKCPKCESPLLNGEDIIKGEKFRYYICFMCGTEWELIARPYLEYLIKQVEEMRAMIKKVKA